MKFKALLSFIQSRMRMSHIYQPVMLMALLRNRGECSEREIAKSILAHDESQIEYYEGITRGMVGRVLRSHNMVEFELNQRELSLEEWMTACEKAFNFALYARCWFAEGDSETKRTILSALGSNLTLINKKVSINLANPLLQAIENTKKEFPEASPDFDRLEPRKKIVFTSSNVRLVKKIPILLRHWKDVRTYYFETILSPMWDTLDNPILDELRNKEKSYRKVA